MSEKLPGADEQSLVVNNLIAEYMSRTDSGEKITPEQFIAEHSDHAEELSRHFENVNALKELQQTSNQSSSATDQTIIKPDDPTDETTAQTIVRGTADSETSVTRKHTSGSSSTTNIEISETFGRYSIQKVLGQGAMGAVYLAKDTQLDRDVALKIPKFGDLSQVDEEEMLARFYREARAAATLRSANICPVYDVGEIDGQHYITMAYIEGRPLKDFTKSKKAHSEKQIATTIRKLAVGLAQAHKIGVVHRDLKPANIMVDQQGEPVVMDFGLARRSSSDDVQVTQSGAILGTPAYMSPEQVEGDQAAIGPQADIYALGIIMYELITGEMPFKGSLMAILQQIALNNPKKPSELRKDVDPRLEKICLKMMAGDLSKRYRSMNEVAAELQDVLKNPNKKQKKEQSKKTGPKPTSIPSAHEESQPALISVEQPKSYADQLRKKKGKSPSDSKVKSQNKSKIQTASKSGTSRPSRKQLIAGGLGGLILLLGIVFIVRLGKYDVEITLEDPSIQLSVDGKELIIDDGHQIKRLAAGEHQLKLVAGNLVTEVDSFIVTKDGKTALTAKIINGEISVSRNDKKLSPANVAKSSVKPQGSTNINLKNGLVGHWNFEDGRGNQVGDSSGNKNAGRTEGEVSWEVDAAPSPLAGKRSLRFGTGKMRVPASSSLAIDTKSAIAFWCKLDQHASGQSILKSDSFEITSSHQRINFIYRLADSEGRVFQDSGEYKPDDLLGGTWNHVVVNCAGDHTEIWYNGRQYSSGPLNGKLEETSSGYVIGSGVQGSLDDLRIYDRTLTKAEIRQLANVNDIGSLEISDEPLNKFQFDSLNSNATNQPKVHFQSGLSFPSPECYAEVRDLDIDLTQPFCMEAWFDPRNQHGSEIYQRVIANLGPCQLALTNFGDTSLLGNFYQEVEGIVSVQKGAHLTYEQHKSGLTHAALQWTGSEMELFLNGELVKHDYESYGHSEDPLMFAKRVLGESKSPALRIGAPNKAGSEGFLSSSLYEFRLTEGIRYEQNFTPGILTSDAQTKILYDFKPGHGEVLKDSSGNGHHGKIIGAKWVDQSTSPELPALSAGLEFNSKNAFVDCGELPLDVSQPLTVELWFRPTALSDLNSHDYVAQNPFSFGPFELELVQLQTRPQPHWSITVKPSSSEFGGFATGMPVSTPLHQPVHIACQWGGKSGELELWVDGKKSDKINRWGDSIESDFEFFKRLVGEKQTAALQIGAASPRSQQLHGVIHQFHISQRRIYSAEFVPPLSLPKDDRTLVLYHFETGHGDELIDSSGNDHHGKIIGAKWVGGEEDSSAHIFDSERIGLQFHSEECFVDVPNVDIDLTKPFSLEAWCRPNINHTTGDANRIIADFGRCHLKFHLHSHAQAVLLEHSGGRLSLVGIEMPHEFDDHLMHIAMQWTGEDLLLFVNGVPSEKELFHDTQDENHLDFAKRILSEATSKNLRIGNFAHDPSVSSSPGYFDGDIYSFRISQGLRYSKKFIPQKFVSDSQTKALYDFHEGFGEVLHDISGNGHDGKISGAEWVKLGERTSLTKPPQRTSRETSLQFSNPEDEVIIPTLKDDTDALTIEVWLQRDETHIAAHSQIVGFGKETAINSNFANALDFRIVNAGYDDGPTQNGSTYGVFHPVHIAGVRDPEKGEIRLYHDGKLMKTSPARMKRGTGSLHIASNEYQWKGNNLGFDHSFSGWIDELRVSKSVRYKEEFTPERRFEKDDQTAALYHFETGHGETLKDSSGNGHDGKILGAKWVKYSASQLPLKQTFLQFDGINDYVEIPTLAFDREKPFTIEGWVKIYDGKPIAENDKAENWDPIFTTNGKHRPRPASTALIFDRPRPGWWCSQNDKESDSLKSAYRNPSGKFGTYQHVAVVYDGQTLSLFEDGKLLSKSSKSLPLPSDKFTEDLKPHVPTIGWAYYRALNAYRYFYGEMRAFRISNEARYSQEFIPENHFDSDGSSILLYDFTEGSGNILEDTSGNGHDGKIIGAKWGGQSPKLSEHALDFSDPRAFVTFPNIDLGKMKPFTLETVVTLPPPITGRDRQEIFITTAPRVGIYVLNDYKTLEINFADQSQKENRRVLVDHELKPNEAVHIATVFDGQQLILFLNGRRLEPIGENVRFKDPAGPPRLILGGVVDQLPGHELPNALKYSYGGLIHMVRVSNAVRYQSDFTPQFQFEPDPLNIGLYHFDEGTGDVLKDASGNGHDGKIVGAKWVKADALSQPEQYSLQFENANDVVTFANPGATLTHPVTVEMWVASDPPPENTRQRRHLASIGLDQGLIGLDLRYNLNEQNKTSLITEIVGPANLWTSGSLPASESDQRGWMHLAQIWTGSELQIYINGRRRWGNPMDGEDSEKRLPENVFAILGGGTDLGKPFQGRIRELRISNSIRYQKNFDLPLPDVPFENDEQTFALYHFNEGTGDFLEDASGKGHDGKIIGAKWVKADVENDGTFASNEPDRRAAEFVLRKGGTVAIVPSREGYGTPIAIKKLDELSHTPFRLVSVEFGNVADVHDGDLQPLEELTHLNQVHLQNTNITNQSLSYLSHISELSNISLYGTKVTDAGLKKLANLELLSTLHMTRTNLEHEGVQGLQSLPSLTTLTLSSITRERLLELAKVSQLRHLGLFSSNLTAVDVANFQKLNPNCRVFIDSKLVGSDPVREVAEWAQQMGATVSVYPMGTFDVAKFNADQSLPEETFDLRAINFHGSDKVTSDDLKKLSICPDLKIVTLDSARITDEEIAQLLGCRALTSVSLVRTDISDASLKALVQLPNLRNLYCSLTGISDTGVSHLRHAQRLHNLELNATKITGKAISHIAEIKTLSNLSIAHNDIHDDDLGPLTMMKSLRELNLTRTKVTAKGVARLKQALPECTIDSDFTDEEIRREMGQSSQPRNNQPTKSETLTRREWSEPVNLGPEFNTSGYDAVSLSADGLTLFVQSERPGGFGQEDLWFSQRASLDEDFTSLENLGPEINSKQNEGGAFLSADGLTLMFASNRPGGQGDNDLWMSKRSDRNAKFSKPVNLGDNINDSMSQGSPQLTADGLTLTLTSNTKLNGWATMQHQRSSLDDPFGESKYVTGGVDGWLSPDGLSLVAVSFQKKSDLQINAGKEDIFLFTRTSVEKGFGKTKFLEGANSSHRDKVPVLSPDGNTIYFVSNRPGGLGNFDIWKSHRVKKGRSPSTSQSAASP